MVNSSDETTNLSSPTETKFKQSSRLGYIFFILIILILANAGATAWLWVYTKKIDAFRSHYVNDINKTISNYTANQQQYQNQIAQLSQQLDKQQTQTNFLEQQIDKLAASHPNDPKRWSIAEIHYLIHLANLQLTINHSSNNALILLRQAEQKANSLPDASLDQFRQELSQSIRAVISSPEIDFTMLITKINALRDQIPNLSLLTAPKTLAATTPVTEKNEHKKWWARVWDNIKFSLQQLVIVRRGEQELPTLIAPDQKIYLQQSLQQLLNQAQWAALNHQEDIYKKSLTQIKEAIEKFYVQSSTATQDFLKQLQILMAINVSPTNPDISKLLTTLDHVAE